MQISLIDYSLFLSVRKGHHHLRLKEITVHHSSSFKQLTWSRGPAPCCLLPRSAEATLRTSRSSAERHRKADVATDPWSMIDRALHSLRFPHAGYTVRCVMCDGPTFDPSSKVAAWINDQFPRLTYLVDLDCSLPSRFGRHIKTWN